MIYKEDNMADYNSTESEVTTVTLPLYRYEQLVANETRIIAFNDFYQSQKYEPNMNDVCSILGIPQKKEDE